MPTNIPLPTCNNSTEPKPDSPGSIRPERQRLREARFIACLFLLLLAAFHGPLYLPLWTLLIAAATGQKGGFKRLWQIMCWACAVGVLISSLLVVANLPAYIRGNVLDWIAAGIVMWLIPRIFGWDEEGRVNKIGHALAWVFGALAGVELQAFIAAKEFEHWQSVTPLSEQGMWREAGMPSTEFLLTRFIIFCVAATIAHLFVRMRKRGNQLPFRYLGQEIKEQQQLSDRPEAQTPTSLATSTSARPAPISAEIMTTSGDSMSIRTGPTSPPESREPAKSSTNAVTLDKPQLKEQELTPKPVPKFLKYGVIGVGLVVALVIAFFVIWLSRGRMPSAGKDAAKHLNPNSQSVPSTAAPDTAGRQVNFHPIASTGFWLGEPGKPLLRQPGSGEYGELTEVGVYLDTDGKTTYLASPDDPKRIYPMTDLGRDYLVIEVLNIGEWERYVPEHPNTEKTLVVQALCKQGIPVLAFEGAPGDHMTPADDVALSPACKVFTPDSPPAPAQGGDATPTPHDIIRNCTVDPHVKTVTAELAEGTQSEMSLYDCGTWDKFLIVSNQDRNELCSVDFTLAYVDDGFNIGLASSRATISTTVLSASGGNSAPWTVVLTIENGKLTATSDDNFSPKVECER